MIETAAIGAADVLVTRDDDLKGAPEVISFLGELGILVRSVRQSLADLADLADLTE